MPDLARSSQGIGRKPGLLPVDLINGFSDPGCPLGLRADAVGNRNPEAHAANLFDLNAKYADVLGVDEVLSLLAMLKIVGYRQHLMTSIAHHVCGRLT